MSEEKPTSPSLPDVPCLTFLVPEIIPDPNESWVSFRLPSPEPTEASKTDEIPLESMLPPSLQRLLEEKPRSKEPSGMKSWLTTVLTCFRRKK